MSYGMHFLKKSYFLLWKKRRILSYFHHKIVIYSTKLFDCSFNFKFCLDFFIFLNINTNWNETEFLRIYLCEYNKLKNMLKNNSINTRSSWKAEFVTKTTSFLPLSFETVNYIFQIPRSSFIIFYHSAENWF